MLELLAKLKDHTTRVKFFKLFDHWIIKAIREICHNALVGNLVLDSNAKRKYKFTFRKLADPHVPRSTKRRLLLSRKKNILQVLIPPTVERLKNV